MSSTTAAGLLEKASRVLTTRHYSRKTIKASSSTQNQALAALLFFYRNVIGEPLEQLDIMRARRTRRAPIVLTPEEVTRLLAEMSGIPLLVCMLLYGSGMRLGEALNLRVKDIDFGRGEITVREAKGRKDRITMLPAALRVPLKEHLQAVREQHTQDLSAGLGRAPMPYALSRKYPNADREWAWQWVFPASSHYLDKKTGIKHRHHLHESVIQKAMRAAGRAAGLTKHATPHVLRHSFATCLIDDKYDIRTVQELLGHEDVRTTQAYTHVLNGGGHGVRSPWTG
ncbi:MAG: integron integrase [Actinobacteria bacterium]|nr:integron integrase [Actinomycetota bacterium]